MIEGMATKIETVIASLVTNTGLVRDHNEDFIGSWEPQTLSERQQHGWVYIVADGVGGAEAGEIASQHATEQTIHHYITNEHHAIKIEERLLHALQDANDNLRDLAEERVRGRYMATTMVATVIHEGKAYLANVGDSRGYLIREGVIRQITKDQSLVAQLLEEGAITAEEALNHPRRNVILSSLGPMRDPKIDIFTLEIEEGDHLFLCSDGLNRHVQDEEIAQTVTQESAESASKHLCELANERGGTDNISVAIIYIPDNSLPKPATSAGVPLVVKSERTSPAPPSRGVWGYTILLSVIEAVLIVLVYYWLRV